MDIAVTPTAHPIEQLDSVVIRFAGDSGDGMQLTGDRFTAETASMGNDLATLPKVRAHRGSRRNARPLPRGRSRSFRRFLRFGRGLPTLALSP